jgi:FixJ family two-component response regulator
MMNSVVYIVDDDAAVRNGIKFLLYTVGYDAEALGSAKEFLDAYDPERAGCLLLDVEMPSMSGLELQQQLNSYGSQIPIIFVTGHGTIPLTIEAIKAGAFDLIEKPIDVEVLIDKVQRALHARAPSDEERLRRAQLAARARFLTVREREVLALVATGETCKSIARQLGISFRTIEAHRAHLIQKLGARGPSDLVRLAAIVAANRFA